MKYDINFDENFVPLYGATITLPPGSVMWRGFDPTYPPISDRPAYFGSRRIAQAYAEKYGQNAQPFVTSGYLHLLDIRYMKVLLSQLFEDNVQNPNDRDIVTATTISFGLCSLDHQIKLFKYRYNNIFKSNNPAFNGVKEGIRNLERTLRPGYYEQKGVRIAETTNDAFVMGFLKELFGSVYHGYISPSIMSPFHVEKSNFMLNSELVIFNPAKSGIKHRISVPAHLQSKTINDIILHSGRSLTTIDTRGMEAAYYRGGSGVGEFAASGEVCDDYNHEIDKGTKSIIKLFKKGEACGKRWANKTVKLYDVIAPGPEVSPDMITYGWDDTFIPVRRPALL